jgi:hypothetical protein
MAIWYCSSAAYAAVPQFAISTAYTVGQIVRSLAAPTANNKGVFRCTTAGTSGVTETGWYLVNNGTTAQGTATFTCVTGQSAYGWGAASGDIGTITNAGGGSGFAATGDTIYVSSDHSESGPNLAFFQFIGGTWAGVSTFIISVNRGGSVPPVAGDIAVGATITCSSGAFYLDPTTPVYMQGFTLIATSGNLAFNTGNYRGMYLKNCALQLNGTNTSFTNNNPAILTLDNTTVQFANVSNGFLASYNLGLNWINTSAAIQGATIPTSLFKQGSSSALLATCRGIDLSAETGTLVQSAASGAGIKALFDSCKIASGVTRLGSGGTLNDTVELVNCYDGTNTINERYTCGGNVTTERTITLSGGAADDIGIFSHKFVSNATLLDRWSYPLEGFWLDVENTAVGSSKTATVEIISSASLNNDDVSLLLQHQGTSGSPVASAAWSLPATPITANAAITTSTATWNSSPATPVKQKLQITFTPQVAGRVRGLVRLGKPSTTVYINPQITIT